MKFGHLALLSCVLAVVGCSESHPSAPDAAIIINLDGAMIDTGVDAYVPPTNIGVACLEDTDCVGPGTTCLADPDLLPGGYCTLACTAEGDECPDGSECIEVGRGQAFCFDSCDPSAAERECRAGYGCGSFGFGATVCFGGCSDATDCPSGLECDPTGGNGAGGCFDPGASVGDECDSAEDCTMGGFCLSEGFEGYPRGACISIGCALDANTGCPGDAQCLPGGRDGLCIDGCAVDGDCRAGYACSPTEGYPDRLSCQPACTDDAACADGVCNSALGTCAPPFTPGNIGAECSRFSGGCEGGTCLTEGQTGFPGAYCAYIGCSAEDPCPEGGVCGPGAAGRGICFDGCATDADCTRAGYACRDVDYEGSSTDMACMPACTDDSECANRERFGFECNQGTGLCGAPFAGTVGAECVDEEGCVGGRCLVEADGWTGGYCVALGCALSGEGGETCPVGTTCTDDELGNPEIGYCLQSCTAGASTGCRDGYECAVEDRETEGVCRPAETAPPTR